jgi:hypothetical protein
MFEHVVIFLRSVIKHWFAALSGVLISSGLFLWEGFGGVATENFVRVAWIEVAGILR